MPIYEYQCASCGHTFEELVFSKSAEVACPKCGSKEVNRLLSAVSFSMGAGSFSSSMGSSCTGCTASSCSSCGSSGRGH